MIRYPLATSSWDDREYQALQRVIDRGQFTMAEETAEFERRMADYLGIDHCVMVNSGSTANLLMVAAMFYRSDSPLRRGDVVVVPAVSWPTTYYPLYQYGLRLRFVDVDLDTLNYDLDALEAALDEDVRLIMAVNLLGNPNDFERISMLAQQHGIEVVEDNCESLGATFDGRQAGTFGSMGTFSTFFSHHISTMEGGVVCTADEELHHILLCLRAHGWTRNLPRRNRVTGTKSDDPFVESFNFVLPGYSVRPLELSAAVGIEQLAKLPDMIEHRRANAKAFQSTMANIPGVRIQREIGRSSWFGFSMVLEEDASVPRSAVIEALTSAGIETRPVVAGNFAKNPVMGMMDCDVPDELPNADAVDSRGFFVGNREVDLRDEIFHLEETISLVLGGAPA